MPTKIINNNLNLMERGLLTNSAIVSFNNHMGEERLYAQRTGNWARVAECAAAQTRIKEYLVANDLWVE